MSLIKTLIAILLLSAGAFGLTCIAAGPTSAGSANGTSWTNREVLPTTAGSYTANARYYVMDGSYASSGVDLNATIEIRKAQSYDFGRASDGCTNDISAGWNAGTMGAGQAIFAHTYFGHMFFMESQSNVLTLNGNGQQTTPGCGGAVGNSPTAALTTVTDCGIKIDNSVPNSTDLISGNTGATFTAKYVEILGSGNASNEHYLMRADNSTGTVMTHMYIHHFGAVCAVVGGAANLTFSYNYMFRNQITLGADPAHGQCLESFGDSGNFDVDRNVYRDLGGTAIMMAWVGSGSVQAGPYRFYDNVIWTTPGFTPAFPAANGLLACINGFTCNNVTMSNNTIALMGSALTGIDSETGGSYTAQNNLWYQGGAIGDPAPHGSFTENHNSYLASGASCPAGTANVCDNASANPFTNSTTGNFTLASDAANWNNRVSLSSPYSTDVLSTTYTTDRGAYQFGNSPQGPAGAGAFFAGIVQFKGSAQ